MLTKDQHMELVKVGDSFWDKLGQLAAVHIAQFPEDVEAEVTTYLQDKCSIYGTEYDIYLKAIRRENESIKS